MEPFTVGKYKEHDYRIPLRIDFDAELNPATYFGDGFRLVLIEKGTGIIKLADRRLVLSAPVLFCFNEQEKPCFEEGKVIANILYFHPKVVNNLFDYDNIRSKKDAFHEFTETERSDTHWFRPYLHRNNHYWGQISIGPATVILINNLLTSINREIGSLGEFWPCRSRSYFLELLFLTERLSTSCSDTFDEFVLEKSSGEINEVILYLHNNYRNKITIDELTKFFHINRTSLAKRFQQATGMSLVSYLNKLRIRLASLMLRDTALPVSEIMERVGFNDQTHFGRVFKKLSGYSPGEYRDQYSWMK